MNPFKLLAVTALCITPILPLTTRAADGEATATPAKTEKAKPSADQVFVRKAAQGGMLEVKLGELASKQASSQDVKDFGAKMVTDHTKISTDLKTAAEKNSFKVPAKLNKAGMTKLDDMTKLQGTDFDKAYVAEMVKAHEADSAAFTAAKDSLENADLKAAVTTALPVINDHLAMIKGMADKMK